MTMNFPSPDSQPLPSAVYLCESKDCLDPDDGHPPETVRWWSGSPTGWFCTPCIDHLSEDDQDASMDWSCMVGPTLAEEIARRAAENAEIAA